MRIILLYILLTSLLITLLVAGANLRFTLELRRASQFIAQHPSLIVVNAFTEPSPAKRSVDRTYLIDPASGAVFTFRGRGINAFTYVPDHPDDYLIFSTMPDPDAGFGALGRWMESIPLLSDTGTTLRRWQRSLAQGSSLLVLLSTRENPHLSVLMAEADEAAGGLVTVFVRLAPQGGRPRFATMLFNLPNQLNLYPSSYTIAEGKLIRTGQIAYKGRIGLADMLYTAWDLALVDEHETTFSPTRSNLASPRLKLYSMESGRPLPLMLDSSLADRIGWLIPLDPEGRRVLATSVDSGSNRLELYLFQLSGEREPTPLISSSSIGYGSELEPVMVRGIPWVGGSGRAFLLVSLREELGTGQTWELVEVEVTGEGKVEVVRRRRISPEQGCARFIPYLSPDAYFDPQRGDLYVFASCEGKDAALLRYPYPWDQPPQSLVTFPGVPDRAIVYRVTPPSGQ